MDTKLTKVQRKAADEWMDREGFIRRTPNGFVDDVASEDCSGVEDTAVIFDYIADRLQQMVKPYRDAASLSRRLIGK